jgi:hypothetical protein
LIITDELPLYGVAPVSRISDPFSRRLLSLFAREFTSVDNVRWMWPTAAATGEL